MVKNFIAPNLFVLLCRSVDGLRTGRRARTMESILSHHRQRFAEMFSMDASPSSPSRGRNPQRT